MQTHLLLMRASKLFVTQTAEHNLRLCMIALSCFGETHASARFICKLFEAALNTIKHGVELGSLTIAEAQWKDRTSEDDQHSAQAHGFQSDGALISPGLLTYLDDFMGGSNMHSL